ncbi:SPOR domain-containing protein [Chromobacterium alticapitis]|uniref:SPOR domain-containing protein n=1 Tax=Chromobacterium alticapitis TaxID=2073169 RepID=A0A2S5DDV5_9NEIS|nr:SPOR domain-containing protein [Chromobacterium alticapitis]POZ61290.1 SPOR domain-containing protein [Chromobacterium alticapitis]
MKWLVALVVVLNLLVAMYGTLKQRAPLDIHAQEVSPGLVRLLPPSWKTDASAAQASAPAAAASAPVAGKPAASAPVAQTKAEASTPAVKAPEKPAQKPAEAAGKKPQDKPAEKAAEKPADKPAEKTAAQEKATACYRWGALNDSLLARVKGGMPQLKLKAGQLQEDSKDENKGSGKFWVYYPPLATQSETKTLSAELKDKGFDNYIVGNDEFKGNLSLGLFGREEAAKTLVARLKAAGYDKAVVKSKSEPAKMTTLSFKALDATQAEHLKALQKRLTPGIPLKGC